MKRENFGSRLGFILVSAGCAIGLGNVWKFPYICGQYGGAAFILIYLIFLIVLGLPVLICEFAMGRASQRGAAKCFDVLAPKGTSWKHMKYFSIVGCYLLMMFYTTVGGWMMNYCVKSLKGDFSGASPKTIEDIYNSMLGNAPTMLFWTVLICVIGFAACALGLRKGIEKISKVMMSALLIIMVVLAVHSVMMKGAGKGVKFYLVPDFGKILENGIGNVIFAALSQAFFTLSIGIGCMLILGSYLDKSRSLLGESLNILGLDTFVALTAGFIVIPACFAYGIAPGFGPGLVFITLPNIFAQVSGGTVWSFLFFLFLTFAALSTIIAVYETLVAFHMDLLGWTRKKSVLVCAVSMLILSLPCVLGFNVLSDIHPLGEGSNIMDLEDFLVSNNLLPLGSLCYVLFCTKKNGWGWDNFIREVNAGKGRKFPQVIRSYVTYALPLLIIIIYLKGYYDYFKGSSELMFVCWMAFAVLLLAFVLYCAFSKGKRNAGLHK